MHEESLKELYRLSDGVHRLLDESYGGDERSLRFKPLKKEVGLAAQSLEEIGKTIEKCTKCNLAKGRTKSVPGEGNHNPSLLVVGEGPGRDEDRTGRPFVGQAGNYFETWMKAIKLSREGDFFITNIVKCRPPENRDPLNEEIEACLPYLERQIELLQPRVILCLGRVAAYSLLGLSESLTLLRGKKHNYHGIPVVITYHPAAVLRNLTLRAPVWEDLKKVTRLLSEG
ncbi:MAG: uracil-DNA glycosylase [Sphaerochaetaceae bacterium]|jgi:uracil-DNA glycosylase family 4|nr:uracil-DNA glycosylase [Sphaerochaetaceae bacterium]HHU88446.1 uracil-DNA glycosylase [Spirochaetales bacterium]